MNTSIVVVPKLGAIHASPIARRCFDVLQTKIAASRFERWKHLALSINLAVKNVSLLNVENDSSCSITGLVLESIKRTGLSVLLSCLDNHVAYCLYFRIFRFSEHYARLTGAKGATKPPELFRYGSS